MKHQKRIDSALEEIYAELDKSFGEFLDWEKRSTVMLFVWISTKLGITLRQACERFCIEYTEKFSGEARNPFDVERNYYLVPRDEPIEIDEKDPKFHNFLEYASKIVYDIIQREYNK